MESDVTKNLKKKKKIFGFISTFLWIGTAFASAVAMFCKLDTTSAAGTPIFSEEFKTLLISIGTTALVGIIAALFIKEKARTTIWMICLILNASAFKEVGMYVTIALWMIDEYAFYNLYKYYKRRVEINKEIDLRIK